ncbi:MAG: RNA polymerase sigma factor RpoD/SigA [Gemmatimonadales bacterium]
MTVCARPARRRAHVASDITNGDGDSIDQYLRDVSRYALLTAPEENALGLRARAGDEGAVTDLVNRNLRFVISVAKKYQNRGLPLGDLIAEGNVGLFAAAHRFDPGHGVRFISYAVWWIRQAIRSAVMRQSRIVRVPASCSAEERRARDVSLDAPVEPDGEQTLLDLYCTGEESDPERDASISLLSDRLEKALGLLPARDARILRLHFGLEGGSDHTLEAIGGILEITRERVRQLRDRALRRLREAESARQGAPPASFLTVGNPLSSGAADPDTSRTVRPTDGWNA